MATLENSHQKRERKIYDINEMVSWLVNNENDFDVSMCVSRRV